VVVIILARGNLNRVALAESVCCRAWVANVNVDGPRIEDVGDHRFLVTMAAEDETVQIEVYVDPAVLDSVGVAPTDEQRLVYAAFVFLLERQRADELPSQLALDEVAAVYDGFLDDVRARISVGSTSTD
jgi:hypothetical protein